jgi:hypothetical protein
MPLSPHDPQNYNPLNETALIVFDFIMHFQKVVFPPHFLTKISEYYLVLFVRIKCSI